MSDSGRAIRTLCQRCGQWRENVNQETDWTCRECHLEAQGQRLLALVEARGRERDEVIRQAERLHQSLLRVTEERALAHEMSTAYGAKAEEARKVARLLLHRWIEPAIKAESGSVVIADVEAQMGGRLDWLREKEG